MATTAPATPTTGNPTGATFSGIDQPVVELEGVEIAHHHEVARGIGGLHVLYERGQRIGLGLALGAYALAEIDVWSDSATLATGDAGGRVACGVVASGVVAPPCHPALENHAIMLINATPPETVILNGPPATTLVTVTRTG